MRVLGRGLVLVIVSCGFAFIVSCGVSEVGFWQLDTTQTRYLLLRVYSDPPGAHVYHNSEYFGQTAEGDPVDVLLRGHPTITRVTLYETMTEWFPAIVTLKKRGFEDEDYERSLEYAYYDESAARANPEKVVVVLEPH